MLSRNTMISAGIVLLLCLAGILPALALDLNPMSYIVKQTTPLPAVTRITVEPTLNAVPARTLMPVTQSTTPGSFMKGTPANVVPVTTATTVTQVSVPSVLEGTVTEVLYYGFQSRFLAVLKISGTNEEVLLTAPLYPDRPEGTITFWDMLQTAYLKGNLVKVYPDKAETFEYPMYSGTRQYTLYTIETIDLGPVHPA
jgi:hypothetical protein